MPNYCVFQTSSRISDEAFSVTLFAG